MRGYVRNIIIAGAVLISAFSCSRQIPGPVSPPRNDAIPPTPTNLTASIGDRVVFLTWSVADTHSIKFYRVYRADSLNGAYNLLTDVTTNYHSDRNLQNGVTYYYKVSTVNLLRFEGYLSNAILATPNLFGILINDGQVVTSNPDVTLALIAPLGTLNMEIASDSMFTGSVWENYAATKSFRLPAGEAVHTVYVRYRDGNDQTTTGNFYDSIILDTRAFIDSIAFSPSGQPFMAGESIHFKLFAGEPDGVAGAVVGQNLIAVDLFDNGLRGDAVAGDGIYEANYIIANNLDFENASVFGNFTDQAGNAARRAQARLNISVRRAPDPVSIISIFSPTGFFDRLQLEWSSSGADDFAFYRLYRSSSANVDSSDFLVQMITSAQTTSYVDTGLIANATYYYKIYVVDNSGLWSGSNEVHAITGLDNPPAPVVLFPAIAVPGTHDRLSLNWSESGEQDFLRYELFRSYDSNVNNSDVLVLSSSEVNTCIDSSLAADSTYYYRVMVLDQGGNSSWSNPVNGHTGIDDPPEPATIFPINLAPDNYTNVRLQWSHQDIPDFQVFRLYSWRTDTGRNDSVLVAAISNQDSLSFIDHPAFDGNRDTLNYWYIIHTYDMGGNGSPSNIVRAQLIDLPPGPSEGVVIPESTFISISWIRPDIPDFSNYRLLRDTLATPNQARIIFMSSDQETTSFDDRNLTRGLTYYYWLDVYDRRDNSSRTLMGSTRW